MEILNLEYFSHPRIPPQQRRAARDADTQQRMGWEFVILKDLGEFLEEEGLKTQLYESEDNYWWLAIDDDRFELSPVSFEIDGGNISISLDDKESSIDREKIPLADPNYREKAFEYCNRVPEMISKKLELIRHEFANSIENMYDELLKIYESNKGISNAEKDIIKEFLWWLGDVPR